MTQGGPFYSAAMHAYPWQTLLNTDHVILNSLYGKPLYYQLGRSIRVGVRFTF